MADTEERDLIDLLIDALNDGVDDVVFDRDALDTNRPEDWGAVELVGQSGSEWADGKLIDQVLEVDVWVCVQSRGSGIRKQAQNVLKDFTEHYGISWRLKTRSYLYDLDKVLWHWTVQIWGIEAEGGSDGGDLNG